jgi:trimeric autotransporter adhesin
MNVSLLGRCLVLALCGLFGSGAADAQRFVYRGELAEGGVAADGRYGLRLTLYAQQHATTPLAGPIVIDAVQVTAGQFATEVDFGALPGWVEQGWLEVEFIAEDGSSGPLPERSLVQTKAQLCPESWTLAGNAATGAANFLGTTDDRALELRVNNEGAWRAVPRVNTPSIVGGHATNSVALDAWGATIGGGGSIVNPNRVIEYLGTVAGGAGNTASGISGTVGGGFGNHAVAGGSVVAGGYINSAAGPRATVAGGASNHATGGYSAVAGGASNTAIGLGSAIGGGNGNCAGGDFSWVGGQGAKVRPGADPGGADSCSGLTYPGGPGDSGTFLWYGGQGDQFVSSGPRQFLVRADGGVGFNSSAIPAGIEMMLASRGGPGNVDLYLRSTAHARGINIAMLPTTGAAEMRIAHYDGVSFVDRIFLGSNGDFSVTAAAFKPGGGNWSASSDLRLKTAIEPLDGALARLLALDGVRFHYTNPDPLRRPAGEQIGFVAQQVAEVFPGWVGTDDEGFLTVGPQGFEALTVEALRELRDEHAVLRAELAEIRRQLEQLLQQAR